MSEARSLSLLCGSCAFSILLRRAIIFFVIFDEVLKLGWDFGETAQGLATFDITKIARMEMLLNVKDEIFLMTDFVNGRV